MKKSDESPYESEYKAIASRLKEIRKERGYSNYEHVAYELGMSRSAYWKLESGVNFQLKTLMKVCTLFNVTLSEFFKDIDLPKK